MKRIKNLNQYYISDILAAERIIGHRVDFFTIDKKNFLKKLLKKISQNWR